ncbi:hypothetical protein ABH926_000743 [Catenulispora sp. GP43]
MSDVNSYDGSGGYASCHRRAAGACRHQGRRRAAALGLLDITILDSTVSADA